MAISATGLGSGLDIEGLVTQLVSAERMPIEQRIFRTERSLTSDISALGSLKSALSDLQTSADTVSNTATYSQRNATSSDATRVSVSATDAAALGSYHVEVSGLATTHSVAIRNQFSSLTETVGTGTLTFTFGTTGYTAHDNDNASDTYDGFVAKAGVASKTVTIDGTNNTLAGLRDAINEADIGVSAAIVNQGSAYRLLLSSAASGAENSLEISVTDSGDSNNTDANGLSRLAFNASAGTTNAYQTTAGADAAFTINGLSVSSTTNTVTSAVDGLTINLLATTTAPATISVSDNTAGIKTAIDSFVKGYNDFVTKVDGLTAFDATSGVKGPLLGDFTTRTITSQLRTTLSAAAEGYVGAYSRMAEIGVALSSTGKLEVDDTVLSSALENNFDDVAAVLARFAKPSSGSGLSPKSFLDTVPDGTYTVAVSSLATSGKVSATVASAGFSKTVGGTSNDLSVSVDGTASGTITLSSGAYANLSALATELQTKINADTTLRAAGKAVTVSVSGDDIEIRSNSLGSTSTVVMANVGSDTTLSTIGLGSLSTTNGTDLVGTIDGVAGVAAGNVLSGAVGSNAAGMSINVSSTAGGTVVVSNGVTNQFSQLLESVLKDDNALDLRITNLNSRAEALTTDKAQMERRLEAIEKRYRTQFSTLDALLADLTNTGNFLEQQMKNIPVPGASKK
ncbi:flagellar filament capping protein FliD [Luminiphilus sp.]|nr:flagellar filament capping protein FliD [Luminiphilus sp.]